MTDFVDPYLDAEHGCLRNLLEIIDARHLAIEEAAIVAVRLRQLDDRIDVPPPQSTAGDPGTATSSVTSTAGRASSGP